MIKAVARFPQISQQGLPSLLNIPTGELLIQVMGRLLQLDSAVRSPGLNNTVLHLLGVQHQNDQDPTLRQRQKFHMAQGDDLSARQHNDAG